MPKLLKLSAVSLAVILSLGFMTAFNAGAVNENGLTFSEKGGEMILVSADSGVSGNVVIPETVDGKKVTEIDKAVFANSTQITSVSIPGSIRKIGKNAFSGCAVLTSVEFGKSEETVTLNDEVFRNCTALKNLVLPDKLSAIPQLAFGGCALPSITVPEGTVTIGAQAFINNQSLTFVNIPESVTSIGTHAFFGCEKLERFSVADDNPAYTAVDNCLLLKDKSEFIQYSLGISATEYTVPGGVSEIGSGAFAFSSLVKITFPDGIKTIGRGAFQDSADLAQINFPDSLTEIGESAFYRCFSLKEVTIPGSVKEFSSSFSYSGLEKVTILSGVETIPNDAFTGCASLKDVIIPDTVTKIEAAFVDCTSLKEITIPASVSEISDAAFNGCSSLTIVAPEGSYAEKYAVEKGIPFKKQEASNPGSDIDVSKVVINAPSGKYDIRWKFKAHIVAKAKLPDGCSLAWYEGEKPVSNSAEFTTDSLTQDREFTVKIVDGSGNPISSASQEKTIHLSVKSDIFTKIISFIIRLFGSDTVTY